MSKFEDEELLEPISLSGTSGPNVVSSTGFRGGLLMLLLGIWTAGVYGFLNRYGEAAVEHPPPEMEEEAEETGEEIELVSDETPLVAQTPVPARDPQAPDRMRVVSDPSAATILLDGVFVGMTPLEMERPGAGHQLALRKSGYEPVRMTEDAWREGSEVRVSLKPITGRVRLTVSPPHATLWMDGNELNVPENGVLDLPLRTHRIKAVAAGYEDLEIDVLPAIAYERRIQFELRGAKEESSE
ncbi:MAG: PEGA domain-containing protein [Kiritimatiellia bacterium]